MNKKIILAQSLIEIANELDDNGLQAEARQVDEIINILSKEIKMEKSSQFIPAQYREQAIGAGTGLGAATGFGAGWKAGTGIGKLGLGLLGAGLGAGLGALGGSLASESNAIDINDPNALDKINRQIYHLTNQLEKLKLMKESLMDQQSKSKNTITSEE